MTGMLKLATGLLASGDNPLGHVQDKPWKGTEVLGHPLLSAHVAMLVLVAAVLVVVLIVAARARAIRPHGRGYNLVEVFVLFVRDFIARPALHDKTYRYLPYLLTVFFLVLACNLAGMVPIMSVSESIPGMHDRLIGGTPTANLYIVGGLVLMTFLIILFSGVATQVEHFVHRGRSPAVGWTIGFFLYLWSLVPPMPGPIKLAMAPLLILLEFIGVIAKCFALWIRLLANMNAGHILLAVLLGFAVKGLSQGLAGVIVTPASVLGSVAISMLELLVAFIQAFIFTFLSALFIGMAANPHH